METTATTLYPFVPSGPRWEEAISFFAELGFAKEWEADGYAGMRFGRAYFILQRADIPEWAKQQMIVFEVESLDGYWAEIEGRDLEGRFAGVKLKAPTEFPWGREVHIIDPAGVCWHVRQAGSKG